MVLVERGELGGTCVNTGCTPTKTFIASAAAAHRARRASELGVDVREVCVDLPRVVARKDAMVRRWRSGTAEKIESAGPRLRLLRGHGRFVGPRELTVGDERLRAGAVVVDTGARPRVPKLSGLDEVPWLDNRTVMELTRLPEHLVVLGGGLVGCELGQAYRRLGSPVTVIEAAAHLLAAEDDDVAAALEGAFENEGIGIERGARAVSVAGGPGRVEVRLDDGSTVEGSHLLVAVGRVPNTDDLGCDAAGIELDDEGYVRVDDRLRTTAPDVYAVGDCTGGPQFTHVSWDDHRILYDHLTGGDGRTAAERIVPYAAFTDPQVGRVGLSEREAREQGVEYRAATLALAHVARAIETGRTEGLIKVLVDPGTGRLLGAAVVAAAAAELVTVFQVMMAARAPASVLVEAEMIHPAFVEGLQTALRKLER